MLSERDVYVKRVSAEIRLIDRYRLPPSIFVMNIRLRIISVMTRKSSTQIPSAEIQVTARAVKNKRFFQDRHRLIGSAQ